MGLGGIYLGCFAYRNFSYYGWSSGVKRGWDGFLDVVEGDGFIFGRVG